MRRLFLISFLVCGLWSLVSGPSVASATDAEQLADAFQMQGVDRLIGDQARAILEAELPEKLAEWMQETTDQRPGTRDQKQKEKIQKKLEEWIPKVVKRVLDDTLFRNTRIKEVETKIVKNLKRSFNENADRWFGPLYEKAMEEAFGEVSRQLGEMIGQSTVSMLQENAADLLKGRLPGEALKYLQMGRDKFVEFSEKFKEHLPSAQLARAKEQVLAIHIVDMPNQVYGGILAASAAMHFAKFATSCSGFFATCDWHELKRAKEVTETMIWQLKNKEAVTLNLGDFLGLVKMLGDQLGEFDWAALKQVAEWNPANQFYKRLSELEEKLKEIDRYHDMATGKVLEKFDTTLAEIQQRLKEFSDEMLGPLKKLPDIRRWEGLKKVFGLEEGLFGKAGDRVPMDDFKKFGQKLNKKIASRLASAAVKIAEKITGPLAKIRKEERVPAENLSQDSDFDPVLLHNGEFYHTATDVVIPADGFDFQFTRIYRSSADFLGVLGYNWTHNFAEKLVFWDDPDFGPRITYVDPEGKKFYLKQMPEKGAGGLFLIRSADGLSHFFDAEGRLVALQDNMGHRATCLYNDAGQLIAVEDTQKRRHRFVYRDDDLLDRLEDFTGRTWRFEYSDGAEMIAAISPGTPSFPKGKATRYRYEGHRLILIMDPKGQIYLQNFYGADGKMLAQKYGDEAYTIEARYDGRDAWVQDRMGILHHYEHDEEGRCLRHAVLKEDGRWEEFRKASVSSFDELRTNGEEKESKYEYDLWGNIVSVTDAVGNVRRFEVDATNLITQETVNGEQRFYSYDANDNIIRMEIPSQNRKIEFEYDILDRMTAKKEFIAPDHLITTRFQYDPQGRLTRVVEPTGGGVRSRSTGKTRLDWADNGRLLAIADAHGAETRYAYDDAGRLVAEHYPNGTQVTYAYDPAGHVVGMTDALGVAHKMIYDSGGHLIEYRAGNIIQKMAYDKEGRLVRAVEGDVEIRFAYDDLFRMTGEAINGRWVLKNYDEAGNKTGVRYPSGLQVVRRFDEKRRLLEVFAGNRPISRFQYTDTGGLQSQEWGNGVSMVQAFDEAGRVTEQRLETTDQRRETRDPKQKGGWKYFYDETGRLARLEDSSSASAKMFEFEYDAEGKLVSAPPAADKVERDAAGRLLRDGKFVYSYDPLNRLTAVQDAGGKPMVQFAYDVLGRMVRKTDAAGVTTGFVHDDWNIIAEYRDNTPVAETVFGDNLDQPLALMLSTNDHRPSTFYYHTDRQGSVRFLTDAKGEMVERYDYDPYGAMTAGGASTGNSLGYIGRPFDAATGLVNLRHRFYSPSLRVFLTADPLGYKNDFYTASDLFTPRNFSYHKGQGGASRATRPNFVKDGERILLLDIDLYYSIPQPPQAAPEMDLFAYAGGDPVNFYDPLGLYSVVMDRGSRQLALYDKQWGFKQVWEGRTDGQHGNWRKIYGPTPSGIYRIGALHRFADANTYEEKRRQMQAKFGWGKIDLDPVWGNIATSSRSHIRIHGGGTSAADPFAPRQDWRKTQGCIRMQNEDVIRLIDAINRLKKDGDREGSLYVVD